MTKKQDLVDKYNRCRSKEKKKELYNKLMQFECKLLNK
jgi:hypothetical protein